MGLFGCVKSPSSLQFQLGNIYVRSRLACPSEKLKASCGLPAASLTSSSYSIFLARLNSDSPSVGSRLPVLGLRDVPRNQHNRKRWKELPSRKNHHSSHTGSRTLRRQIWAALEDRKTHMLIPMNDSSHFLHRLGVAQMQASKDELLSNRISQKWQERRTNGRYYEATSLA